MSRSGIVNVRMVITEEKILSNIDKIQKLINPRSKKQIVQLEDDTYFKDLIESVKTYLLEYPKKKNFPSSVYKSAYELVEFATNQFEENTKKIETLIRQREQNIALAGELKELLDLAIGRSPSLRGSLKNAEGRFSEDILDTLKLIANSKNNQAEDYENAIKLLKARINNLEANLHIEIDMERIEDRSKALSYIGIEIADALRTIPTPVDEMVITPEEENVTEQVVVNQQQPVKHKIKNQQVAAATTMQQQPQQVVNQQIAAAATMQQPQQGRNQQFTPSTAQQQPSQQQIQRNIQRQQQLDQLQAEQAQYQQETQVKVKPSLWQRIKNSKLGRAVSYVMRIRVVIDVPNALPEGRGENYNYNN